MRRTFSALVCGMALVFAGSPAAVPTASADEPVGRYVVVLRPSVADPGAVAADHARRFGAAVTHTYHHALKGYAAVIPARRLADVQSDPRVVYLSVDEEFAAADCVNLIDCQRAAFWARRIGTDQSSTASGDGSGAVDVNVAVIDSGIDLTHPDLNVVGGMNCQSGDSYADAQGHGTIVAGVVAAKDNGFGRVGAAPGARLWSVRVLKKNGIGTSASLLCGIDWVTATRTDSDPTNDIAVANMSIGGKGSDDGNCGQVTKGFGDALHRAICNSTAAGVTYVVAAGNESADVQRHVPAGYDEVLNVTAMADRDGQPGGLGTESCEASAAPDDTAAAFSNFASLATDIAHTVAASGVCIGSTIIGGTYGGGSGTSFAAPAVTGLIALCISTGACAGLTPAQIITKMVSDAAVYNQANPDYGFTGDPQHSPAAGKYYGNLVRASLY